MYGVIKNWVWCQNCLEWKDAGAEVTFMNIEEDIHGRDQLTFNCDECKTEHTGLVTAKDIKPLGARGIR